MDKKSDSGRLVKIVGCAVFLTIPAQKAQEAAPLEKKIEKIQKKQVAVQAIDRMEPKAVPLSSKVMLERTAYDTLAAAAKKYITQEKRESRLQKALDAANKLIGELKTQVSALTAELSQYRSIRAKLKSTDLERKNEELRGKVRRIRKRDRQTKSVAFIRQRACESPFKG